MISRSENIFYKEKRFLQKLLYEIKSRDVFIILLAFFISRACIMEKLTPFGIPFLSACLLQNVSFMIPLFLSLGVISYQGFMGYSYVVVIWAIYIIYNTFYKYKFKLSIFSLSIFSSVIFTVIKILNLFVLRDYYIYDLLMIVFEGIVVFTVSYVFSYAIPIIKEKEIKFTSEEVICTFIILALALAGINDLSIFNISIKNVVSIFLVLVFSYSYGASLGSGIGVTIGMIAYISRPDMPFLISIYGLSGLLSGVFKDLGKIGSILGFILGNSIMSFYMNRLGVSFLNIKEMFISFVIFFISYKYIEKIISKISMKALGIEKIKTHTKKVKQLTLSKLDQISSIFKDLGNIFLRVSDENKLVDTNNIAKFIDSVANDVCTNCSMNKFCWNDDFYTTYYSMFNVINSIESEGTIKEEKLPELFKNRCLKQEKIMQKFYKVFDFYKLNYMWENRLCENRKLVCEQFKGLSLIIDDLMKDINKDVVFKEDVENSIYLCLKNKGVTVLDVTVCEFEDEEFTIYVEVNKAYRKENNLHNIMNIVSNAIDIPLKGEFIYSNLKKNKVNKFKFTKGDRLGAITRVCQNAESFNIVSGDNYTFGENKNDYFIGLSDGMGVGSKANSESNIAICLLEKFLQAGFSKKVALKTINSVLMLKSNDEMFTTLDISNIDLYTGKLQMIKTGAVSTFIKKKDCVKIINSQSLPVGILRDIDFQVYEEYLEDGDFVIMMSDGVLDANKEVEDKEKWMMKIINNIDSLNPQTIADTIMEQSKKAYKDEIKDDMTVLVTKVWKLR